MTARTWGLGLIFAVLSAGMFKAELARLSGAWWAPLSLAHLGLFGLTAVLLLIWVVATEREMELLFEWLDPVDWSPPSTVAATATIVGFAGFLTLLLFASRDPVAYAAVFTAYSICILFSVRHVNRELSKAFGFSLERLDREAGRGTLAQQTGLYRKGIQVLQGYFIGRPHTLRHVAILVMSVGALLLAGAARAQESTPLAVTAYSVLFGCVAASEALIASWRLRRDEALRPLEAMRRELGRAAPA